MQLAEDFGSRAIARLPSAALRRIVVSSVTGAVIETYDFFLYGAASALIFNTLYFPTGAATSTASVAFVSFFAGPVGRPIGAAIFGHYGDRIGRKAMLATTIIIMGVATSLVGLLPTHDQIGAAAPLLLVCLRFMQGIGLGGEWGGGVLMVVENAPARYRGFFASLVQLGNPLGLLAATAAFAVVCELPDRELMSWGWRIPFVASIAFVGLGLYIRLNLAETPVFQQLKLDDDVATVPLLEVLTHHRRAFFTAVGLRISELAYFRIVSIFAIFYSTSHLGLPRALILQALQFSAFAALLAIPAYGWLSDILGRKAMFVASCLFSIAFAFPLFALLDTKDPSVIKATMVVVVVLAPMISLGVGASWYSELFPARLRYSGASLGFQVGATLGNGLTPVIAASLMVWSAGATWPISVYLIVCACITLAAAIAAPETARKALT